MSLQSSSHMAKWCANTTSNVANKDFNKFMSAKPEYSKEDLLKRVPSEYYSIIKVFMKSNADIVAKHRAKWDHEIYLEEKKTPYVRNYKPLTDQKTAAMKKYIDKHLGKKFIRPSLSAATSPILLVKKPDKGLCFCIDYQALNTVTVKNRYSIPLISEMLCKLAGAVLYTKLDVIHTFNRIQMKENHEWLTAFNSRYGQFEYLVMPFGLCNAPGTFQGYINKLL